MPPRFAFWTILLGGQPTAFRARTQEELLPTLRQLRTSTPDAVMKWFARGRLWESPEEAHRAARERPQVPRESRGPAWRPGGRHEDPRARFKTKPAPDQGDQPKTAARPERPQGRPEGGRPDWRPAERRQEPRDRFRTKPAPAHGDQPKTAARPERPQGRPEGGRPDWRPAERRQEPRDRFRGKQDWRTRPAGDSGPGARTPRGPSAPGGRPAPSNRSGRPPGRFRGTTRPAAGPDRKWSRPRPRPPGAPGKKR
jgi:hypothetical protein